MLDGNTAALSAYHDAQDRAEAEYEAMTRDEKLDVLANSGDWVELSKEVRVELDNRGVLAKIAKGDDSAASELVTIVNELIEYYL